MAFIIEMMAGESVTIGEAKITLEEKKGRNRSRLRIEAPQSMKIVRGPNTEGAGVPQLANVRGDTHGNDPNRPR